MLTNDELQSIRERAEATQGTDIPALLAHIEHLQRRYTMPCPYCDFGSGQRGMDRCPHCDGTGRMDVHVFVAQQRDVARAEVAGLREEVAHQKRALEWLAEQAAYTCSHATGCPAHSQACPRGNTRCLDIEGEDWVRKALDATKESASECRK